MGHVGVTVGVRGKGILGRGTKRRNVEDRVHVTFGQL